MDYGAAGDSAGVVADAVAFLSQGYQVELSAGRLLVECVWSAGICLAAMEKLVRPYGSETRSLEGT